MDGNQRGSAPGIHASMSTPHMSRTWKHRETFSLGPTHSLLPMETEQRVDDSIDNLTALLKITWTIFAVSPLFGFHHDSEVMLKLYGKRLREEIATCLSQEDVAYVAKFTLLENFTSDPTGPPAVHVEVHTIKESNDDNRSAVEKCIYMGNFISWRASSDRLNDGECVRLPLLLCRGLKTAMKAVHMILGRMFDCMIMALPISQHDLMWLVPIALSNIDGGQRKRNAREDLVLEYVLPHLPPRNNIAVKFFIDDMSTLWTAVYESENESDEAQSGSDIIIKLEHVEKFYEILCNQMLAGAGLQLGFCLLHKISLPSITITNNRMKVTNTETMDRVLLFLQGKAFDLLHVGYAGSSNNSSNA